MAPVTVLILAPAPDPAAGPLARVLEGARAWLGPRLTEGFGAVGHSVLRVVHQSGGARSFGAILRDHAIGLEGGIVVVGAASIPLATRDDLAALVEAAAADEPGALATSFFSADAVAISRAAETLVTLPDDLASDNALPRWLAEVAGVPVGDLRDRRHLCVDVDSPLDLLLLEDALPGIPVPASDDTQAVRARLAALRAIARDPAAELFISGRIAAADLARLERGTRARTRVLVEERGLKTTRLAETRGRPNRRPPRSLLAELLLRDGPKRLGVIVADLADGALLDTRVLMAARAGADERGWPSPEDRFASDLLLPGRVTDQWLRSLTQAALDAPVPILLGAHTLVGPGAALALAADA